MSSPSPTVASPEPPAEQAGRLLLVAVLLFGAALGALLWATWPEPALLRYELEVRAEDDMLHAPPPIATAGALPRAGLFHRL